MNQRNPTPIPSIQTWYVTFDFGTRKHIGAEKNLNMSSRWIEVKARQRHEASQTVALRFGYSGWQLHSEEAFTPDRRKFCPDGCCLVLISD